MSGTCSLQGINYKDGKTCPLKSVEENITVRSGKVGNLITCISFISFYYARSRNCETQLLASSCLSVCPHGTTRLPLDGFSWNLIFEDFSKICWERFKCCYNLTRIKGTLHEDQYTLFIISRSISLTTRNISDKSCRENQNAHFMFSNFFF